MGKRSNKSSGQTVMSREKRKTIRKASQARGAGAAKAPKECRDAATADDLDGLMDFSLGGGAGGARAKRLAKKMRRKIKRRTTPKKPKKKASKRGVVA